MCHEKKIYMYIVCFKFCLDKLYFIEKCFCYIGHTFRYSITRDIYKTECITLKLSPSRKFISFNHRKSISLTATCISGLLSMFRLHGIDRWNLRRCMRRLRNRKRFEAGARRQIKILCRIRRKRATVSDAEQTMDVIAFATVVQSTQRLFRFLLFLCMNTLSVSQLMRIIDACKLCAI